MKRAISSDLALLNSARARMNMPPLKSWKESHQKLIAKINKLNEEILANGVKILPPTDPALVREAKHRETIDKLVDKRLKGEDVQPDRPRVLKLEPTPRPAPRPRLKVEGTVTLADLARSIGLNPKIARAKMRKRKVDFEVGQYLYPQDKADAIIAILRSRG